MKLELIEEINPTNGIMYAVRAENSITKWFTNKAAAEGFYNDIIANPTMLESKTNILKSEEINVSSDNK